MKMYIRKFYIASLFLFISFQLGFVSICFANIAVDPSTIEVKGKRGSIIDGSLTLYNKYNYKVEISVSSEDFLKMGINPSIWLKIEPETCTIESQGERTFKYTISIPKDAHDELMAMVIFSIIKEKQVSGVGLQLGIPFYAIVEEDISLKVEIKDFVVQKEGNETIGIIIIKNNSNIHIRPKIKVIVENKENKFKKEFEIPYGAPALAGKEKTYFFKVNSTEIPYKDLKATVVMEYGLVVQDMRVIKKEFDIKVIEKKKEKGRVAPVRNKIR